MKSSWIWSLAIRTLPSRGQKTASELSAFWKRTDFVTIVEDEFFLSEHLLNRHSNPTTIPIPVNDHRADLSTAQADWPQSTLRNITGSPLLAAAACVRGFVDTVLYLIREILLWVADMLETLDQFQVRRLGPRWWIGTEVEQFAPKRKPHAKS